MGYINKIHRNRLYKNNTYFKMRKILLQVKLILSYPIFKKIHYLLVFFHILFKFELIKFVLELKNNFVNEKWCSQKHRRNL